MAAKRPHLWEEAPQLLEEWIDESVEFLYAELTSDGKDVPFRARVTETAKLDYYRERFFNPDGTPNEAGRSEEYERLGPDGYAVVMTALTGGKNVAEPPDFEIGVKSYTY